MSTGTSGASDRLAPRTSAGKRGWDLYAIARSDDPHARWRSIREASPVLDAGDGVYFVTSWAEVDHVLRDGSLLAGSGVAASFGDSEGMAPEVMRTWLMSLDGADQHRARGLVRRAFTPRAVTALEPRIRDAARRQTGALPDALDGETVDLVAGLAFALPSEVIRSLFGVSAGAWRDEVESVIRAVDDRPGASLEMIEALALYFDRTLAKGDVPDGLMALLGRPDPKLGALSRIEIVANAVLLVTAAIDTTAGLIGNAVQCLLARPQLVARLREEPGWIPSIVEETLRFEPPALSCTRRTPLPYPIADVVVPADAQLLLGLAAANRDPGRFPDPDRFDPDREHTGVLTFGGGRHACLGASLARLEARIALEELLVHAPFEIEASAPPRWQTKNPTVRALERLPVRLRTRQERPT